MDYKEFIEEQLKKASQTANRSFGKVSGSLKNTDPNHVLTQTDIEIGRLLVSAIKQEFPNHNIIDEETGVTDNSSNYTWVIDPIDGTSNFANGVPLYGIMIGLLEGGIPLAGGISLPFFKEVYLGAKERGSFCNGQKLQVSSEENLLNSLVAYGIDSHPSEPEFTKKESMLIANIVLNIRNLRSSNSVFDLAMVGKGNYGGWLNQTSRIWDNVAPQIIIEEAGGVYTDFFGKPMDYSSPLKKYSDNFTACAGSPSLHRALQEIILSSS